MNGDDENNNNNKEEEKKTVSKSLAKKLNIPKTTQYLATYSCAFSYKILL